MFLYIAIPILLWVAITMYANLASLFFLLSGQVLQGAWMQNIVHTLNILFNNPFYTLAFLILTFAAIVIMSVVLSFSFVGIFGKLNRQVNGKKAEPTKYKWYFKKYYLKIAWTFIRTGSLLVLFFIASMVFLVPTIIISGFAYREGGSWIIVALVLSLLSIITLFLAHYYIKMYLVFWFPSMMLHKRSFKAARMIVNQNFWKILGIFILADVVFFLGIFLTMYSLADLSDNVDNITSYPMLLGGLACMIVGIVAYFSYVFHAYRFYVEKHRRNEIKKRMKKKRRKQREYDEYDDYDDDYDDYDEAD